MTPRRRHRPSRPYGNLGRTVGVRQPRKTILLFCEGKQTEPEYFETLRRLPDVREVAAIDVRLESNAAGSAPLTLVNLAVAAKEKSEREEGEVDEFWCVFDVEWPKNHPGLADAIRLADDNGVRLAISNPCFELWLILHHQDQTAFLDNAQARRLRRSLDGQPGKGLDGSLYMPHRKTASTRAKSLDRMHSQSATQFPHNNPSSSVYHILLSIGGSIAPRRP